MTTLISGAAPAHGAAQPNPILGLLAGEFTPRVARLWPAPHEPFVSAPAARRHLVCLVLALGGDPAPWRQAALEGRLRKAIAALIPRAPAGLERALGRLGEVAWSPQAYRSLVRLLSEPRAAKVLRHAQAIDPDLAQRLALLPPAMAGAAGLASELSDAGASAVREAYEAICFRSGEAAAAAAAARWACVRTPRALFETVRYDLSPEPARPPHPGTARLKPLVSKAQLRDAGRRFRNCLIERAPDAASGWSAFYEWDGPPGAVVEISRDHVFGWRLDQARLAHNAIAPEGVRELIIDELALMGVHVGRSGWELDRLLNPDAGRGFAARPASRAIGEAFGLE